MKKYMFILAALLAFTGLIACGSSADNTAASPSAPSSGEDFSEASSAMVTTDAQSVPEKHLNIVTLFSRNMTGCGRFSETMRETPTSPCFWTTVSICTATSPPHRTF